MMHKKASDAQGVFSEVPAKRNQNLILFEKIESKLMAYESSEDDTESPEFSHYEPNVCRMMEKMGYDLTKRFSLNFGKGRRIVLQPFILKGKAPDYYHRI